MPRELNASGKEILEGSSIGEFITLHYDEVLRMVKYLKPKNAYQIQEGLEECVSKIKYTHEEKLKLEEEAYNLGEDLGSLYYVGGISIRDKVIKELGYWEDSFNSVEVESAT